MAPQNPFRYRGYYYDYETGFYYLNSRYYDPATGRFINADVYISTGKGILGHNMYAYCRNNPVMRYDSSGYVEQENMDDNPTTPVDDYGPVYTGHGSNQTSGGGDGGSGGTELFSVSSGNSSGGGTQPGSYEIFTNSGQVYVGKGPFGRMMESIKRLTKQGYTVTNSQWTPSSNNQTAFVDEYIKMSKYGFDFGGKMINKIMSPGFKIYNSWL